MSKGEVNQGEKSVLGMPVSFCSFSFYPPLLSWLVCSLSHHRLPRGKGQGLNRMMALSILQPIELALWKEE